MIARGILIVALVMGVGSRPVAASAQSPAAPPDTAQAPPLEVVQVTAARLSRAADTPSVVDRLDESEITGSAASSPSIAQAVQQLPGVGAVGRDGFTSSPTIRGLGRDRSLLLLEGVRLSSDRGVGPSGSFVDPFLARSVEVVRGASGVAYGSGAIGGVISLGLGPVESRRAASARIAGSTNGDGRLVAGRATGELGAGWRAAAGAFRRTMEDYTFPDDDALSGGEARNSGQENTGGTLVLEHEMAGGGLRLAFVGTTADEVGRPTTLTGRLDTIEEEDHVLASAQWSRDRRGERTEAHLGFHRPRTMNRSEHFDGAGVPTRVGRTENVSRDGSAAALIERRMAGGSWLAGLDFFLREDVDATETTVRFATGSTGMIASTETVELVKNGNRADLGAFFGIKRTIALDGELLLAARLDRATRNADERSSSEWIAPSAVATVLLPLDRAWSVTAALARSFRAPRIQELYFAGDRPGGSRLANPELDPETAWSAEAGMRWADAGWSARATLFGIVADDLIVQLPVDAAGDTLRYDNETRGRIAGVELDVGWADAAGRGRAALAYARLHGEDEDGEPLPDVPSGEVRLSGEWRVLDAGERQATLRLAMRAGAAKTPFAPGEDERWWSDVLGASGIGGDEQGHPGFARWDAGLRVRVAALAVVDVSVSNLLDSRYLDRPEPDAYPQPGRSLQVELTLGE